MTIAKEKTRLITADELLRLDSVGIRGELIRGVFYRIRASEFRHSIVGANVCYLLGIFIRPGRMGHLVAARTGVQLEWNPDTVREVDCAYIVLRQMAPGRAKLWLHPSPAGYCGRGGIQRRPSYQCKRQGVDVAELWSSARMGCESRGRVVEVHQSGTPVIVLDEDDALDGDRS